MAADPPAAVHASANKAEEKSRSKLLKDSCRRFWLSLNPLYQTLALGAALLAYLCASALVFVRLERGAEEERIAITVGLREELKVMLSVELPNATSERIDGILDGVVCESDVLTNETVRLWDMGRAVVVAASIVTTVGGDVPSTSKYIAEGTTIVYALFGIPLLVAFLAVMGRLLSNIPRGLLKPLQHRYWIHTVVLFSWLFLVLAGLITIPAAIVATIEGWEYREALYFCFTSVSTIGLGDYALGPTMDRLSNLPLRDFYKLCFVIWLLCGLSHISTIITQVREVWGGLLVRLKKFSRQMMQVKFAKAMRPGKRSQLGKATGVEETLSSKTDASAEVVEKQVGKVIVLENEISSSEITRKRGKDSRKEDPGTSKEPEPTDEHPQ